MICVDGVRLDVLCRDNITSECGAANGFLCNLRPAKSARNLPAGNAGIRQCLSDRSDFHRIHSIKKAIPFHFDDLSGYVDIHLRMLDDHVIVQEAILKIFELLVLFSIPKIDELNAHLNFRKITSAVKHLLSLSPHASPSDGLSDLSAVLILVANLAILAFHVVDMDDRIVVNVLAVHTLLFNRPGQEEFLSILGFASWYNSCNQLFGVVLVGNASQILSVLNSNPSIDSRIMKEIQVVIVPDHGHVELCTNSVFRIEKTLDLILSSKG